jgi:hypothetical protein
MGSKFPTWISCVGQAPKSPKDKPPLISLFNSPIRSPGPQSPLLALSGSNTTMPPPPGIARAPFPARTTTATQDVGDIPTTITATRFSDKLLVTISQDGRLAIWVRPLILQMLELH